MKECYLLGAQRCFGHLSAELKDCLKSEPRVRGGWWIVSVPMLTEYEEEARIHGDYTDAARSWIVAMAMHHDDSLIERNILVIRYL